MLALIIPFLACLLTLLPGAASAQNQASCSSYLATSPNPSGIPGVTGPGVSQRSDFLADGGKLVAIGSRYYTVWIPPAFYSATTPVVVFDLHGTGGYPEAEWNDWHTTLAARGYAFIGLSWGGGAPGADTDTTIYANLKTILQDVGASCPIDTAQKWLLGFSVGSAMSFSVMIRDVADLKFLTGQVAVSGAAIGPLTTGIAVMHSTVEANRSNSTAMQGVKSWMYCGVMDLDHGWSMCDEMPYGESFVNTHGGSATLYKDPTGTHHSLPATATPREQMFDFLVATTARGFLGSSDSFTISTSGMTLYGSAGNDSVTIASGVTGVKLDANIERILLAGNLADYKFAVVAGTGIQVQTAAGAVVVTIPSLNQDGTMVFADGSAPLIQTGASAFSLGGLTVSTTAAAALAATLNTSDKSTAGTTAATTKARVFLGSGDNFTLSNSGMTLYGSSGTETVSIASGVTDIRIDANIEHIELAGNFSDYTFAVVTGTGFQIQTTASVVVVTIPSLNQNAVIAFADSSAPLIQTGASAFTLNGQAVSAAAATTTPGAPTNVTVAATNTQTIGSQNIASSTRLAVSWTVPLTGSVHHYEISAAESIQNTQTSTTSTTTSATLTGLKAGTTYAVTVKNCADASCSQSTAASPVSAATSNEYWQLQGSGNTTAGLSHIVSDGNVRISATRIGSDAGTSTAGRIQLYYGPNGQVSQRQALSTAITSSAASAGTPSSYLSFVSSSATTGLISPSTAAPAVKTIATGQGVPLSAALGSKIRLFFEAEGSDGKSRIYTLDSRDGYVGQDFNSGSPTTCSTAADYSTGGGCVPTLVVGVESDTAGSNSRISNARQNKIGFPVLTDWRWDGAAGTFMVFTTDRISGCTTSNMNHGYAVWDGSAWNVQYAINGCPKLFTSAQAAFPMHLGGVRYKLYYGDPSITTGKLSGSNPFLGPKKLIYADGALSGSASIVDFEDWENQTTARDVVFLWPNGDQLNSTAEGYIDDYHFLSPTGSLDLQVMYLAINNGAEIPFGSAALLLNP
jgi:hypothetical protein